MEKKLKEIFEIFGDNVAVRQMTNEATSEVFEVKTKAHGTYYICAKNVTFGGRETLAYEQRIQILGDSNNYIEEKMIAGEQVAEIGIIQDHDEIIICAFKVKHSNAKATISKQIKNETIDKAKTDGFARQLKGTEFACAFRKEFLYFYLDNASWIHDKHISTLNTIDETAQETVNEDNTACNKLFYGVPGSGKSFAVDKLIDEKNTVRVVFHPDYTYSDFIGQILPKLIPLENGEKKLTYTFVPGPFTKALKDAFADEDKSNMHYLVIEELNRGNAPAIFGDVFQLLDRNLDGSSHYSIINFDIAKEVFGDENHEVKIPSNLTIFATMNTSDQNVFTLDTAFQRRWEMEYIKNDFSVSHSDDYIEGSEISWGRFASVVNEAIVDYAIEISGSEDKQLGVFFAEKNELTRANFPQKVLKYLWDDAFKMNREFIFNENIKSFGQLVESYKKSAEPIKYVIKKEYYDRMIGENASVAEIAQSEIEPLESYPVEKIEE